MRRIYGVFAVAALAALAQPAFAQIKIGSAGPMTGQYAAFGEQLKRGAQMAVDEINAAGGVNGENWDVARMHAVAARAGRHARQRSTLYQPLHEIA